MPGVRRSRASGKGHAPESVIRQRFGEQIREDVLEALLPDALSAAIEEKRLAVLGRPRIDALTWDPPGAIRFDAHLD